MSVTVLSLGRVAVTVMTAVPAVVPVVMTPVLLLTEVPESAVVTAYVITALGTLQTAVRV